jgi:soluble lytic murein transglycosylase-like protein
VSITAVQSRMSEIQAMIAACNGQSPAQTGAAGTSFDQQLQSATGQLGVADSPAGAAQSGSGANTPFATQIDAAAQKYGVDPALLRGLIKQESGFNPNAGSSAGAQGLTQLMPGTARSLGCTNPLDPTQSIDAGAKYLRQQLDAFGGDVRKALAAYNAGPGAVQRYGGVPPYGETQNYVQKVMAYADEYRRAGSSTVAMQAAAQSSPLSYSTT